MTRAYCENMRAPLFDRLSQLSEPMRARILRVLQSEELAVGEIARVLQTSQPTVSRHLKQLDAGGWVQRRKVGTASWYRLQDPLGVQAQSLWTLVQGDLQTEAEDPASLLAEDTRRLAVVLAQRGGDSAALFRRLGGRWDEVRRTQFGEAYVLPTLMGLLPPGQTIADLGCGTGALLPALASATESTVIGIDREAAMLAVAAERTQGLPTVRLEQGQLDALPLADESVDLALCMLVLHHVADLAPAFAEVARVLRPGGRFVVLDMVAHDRVDFTRSMGHQHAGFSKEQLSTLATRAGLRLSSWQVLPADPAAQGPGLFVGVMGRA